MGKVLTWITPESDYQKSGASAPFLFLDSITAFTPTKTARVTQYATSNKKSISNNVVQQNDVLQISGKISSRPLVQYTDNLVGYDNFLTRKSTAYTLLDQWKTSGTLLTVVDEYDVFRYCVITSLEMTTEGNDSLTVNITLESTRRVSYNTVHLIQYMSVVKSTDAENNKGGGTSETKSDAENDGRLFDRTRKTWDILWK